MNPHQHMRAAHGHDIIEKGFLTYEFYHRLFSGPFLILIVFAIIFFSMLKVHTPEKLSGELYDRSTQVKLAGAKVVIYTQKGHVLDSARADAFGRFSFMVQQQNAYRLQITSPGYQSRQIDITPQMNNSSAVILKIGMHR
jgi:ubiquitin